MGSRELSKLLRPSLTQTTPVAWNFPAVQPAGVPPPAPRRQVRTGGPADPAAARRQSRPARGYTEYRLSK